MNAHVKQTEVAAGAKRMRCIPQSYGQAGELINIRELLRLGRSAEALERLERLLDRDWGLWRARGA